MNEAIIYFGCFFFGWKLREIYAHRQVSKMLNFYDKNIQNSNIIIIKLEKQSDVIYAYDNETNEFLGQSQTLEELVQVLDKRYPGKRFTATPENLKELGLYNESV